MFEINKVKTKMESSLSHAIKNFSTLKVGAVKSDFLDAVTINIYEQFLPIKQVATINVTDNSTLVVQPFDKNNLKAISKSIQEANLGVGITNEAGVIRITMPKVTEERRKEIVKILKNYSEDSKIAIRNIRRDAMEDVKKLKKDSIISENDMKRFETEIQKITDDFIKKIDTETLKKETEIMKI